MPARMSTTLFVWLKTEGDDERYRTVKVRGGGRGVELAGCKIVRARRRLDHGACGE